MFFNWVHPKKKKSTDMRSNRTLGLCGRDICSIEDTSVPLERRSSRADQRPLKPWTLLDTLLLLQLLPMCSGQVKNLCLPLISTLLRENALYSLSLPASSSSSSFSWHDTWAISGQLRPFERMFKVSKLLSESCLKLCSNISTMTSF